MLVAEYRLIVLIYIFEFHVEINLFIVSFLPLDAHHVLYAFFDIELLVVLSKFV